MSRVGIVDFATVISWLCGWLYFLAWSFSFYPQMILNIQRRTTQGLKPEFPLLNVTGFSCYTISTAVFLFSPVVRRQYADRHPQSPEPTVRANDLAFGIHALVLSCITYSQFWPRLWRWEHNRSAQREASLVTLGLIWGGGFGIAVMTILVLAGNGDGVKQWAWMDVIYSMSYVKLVFTVYKYLPQMVANFQRRSTIGWAINQPLLDLFGGILSLLQLVIDSAMQDDWSGVTGNPVKLGLALISLVFDVIFIVQHFVLYGPVEERDAGGDDEQRSLLTADGRHLDAHD